MSQYFFRSSFFLTTITWLILSLVCHLIKNRLTPEHVCKPCKFNIKILVRFHSTFGWHNRSAELVIPAIMDRFCITFFLVDNAHPKRCRTVRTMLLWSKVSMKTQLSPSANARSIHFMGDFAEWSWLAGLQIQLVEELKPNDPNFHKKISFCAHF